MPKITLHSEDTNYCLIYYIIIFCFLYCQRILSFCLASNNNNPFTLFSFALTVDNLCEIALSRGVRVQVGPKGVPNELYEGSVALLPYPLLVGAAQVEGLEVGPGRVLFPQRQHQV